MAKYVSLIAFVQKILNTNSNIAGELDHTTIVERQAAASDLSDLADDVETLEATLGV